MTTRTPTIIEFRRIPRRTPTLLACAALAALQLAAAPAFAQSAPGYPQSAPAALSANVDPPGRVARLDYMAGPVTTEAAATPSQSAIAQPAAAAPTPTVARSGGMAWWVWLIALLAVGAVGILAGWFWRGRRAAAPFEVEAIELPRVPPEPSSPPAELPKIAARKPVETPPPVRQPEPAPAMADDMADDEDDARILTELEDACADRFESLKKAERLNEDAAVEAVRAAAKRFFRDLHDIKPLVNVHVSLV